MSLLECHHCKIIPWNFFEEQHSILNNTLHFTAILLVSVLPTDSPFLISTQAGKELFTLEQNQHFPLLGVIGDGGRWGGRGKQWLKL